MEGVEEIRSGQDVLAYVILASTSPPSTTFVTPDDATLQAGFVVYASGGEVVPHIHLPVRRAVVGTPELLMVRTGRCLVDVYTTDRKLVATRELVAGDAILSLAGGHGFRMVQDTVLFELKQGPFTGGTEKERFERPGRDSEGA